MNDHIIIRGVTLKPYNYSIHVFMINIKGNGKSLQQ